MAPIKYSITVDRTRISFQTGQFRITCRHFPKVYQRRRNLRSTIEEKLHNFFKQEQAKWYICISSQTQLYSLQYDYILITNLMHWLLFIRKILFSSKCFEPQMLIFRRIQLYKCSIWYSHREWQYHMLHVYNSILLKMSTWGSKHVEKNSILWINNNQCIKLVFNI